MSTERQLIFDQRDTPGPPLAFRTAGGPWVRPAAWDPPRLGLSGVRASGSHQFCAQGLEALLQALPGRVLLVDLREESHGFLDGAAVSWYAPRNFANAGLSLEAIQADERSRLGLAAREGSAAVLEVRDKNLAGEITRAQSEIMPVSLAEDEAALCARLGARLGAHLGADCARLPVRDHTRPCDAQVERYLELRRALPPETWLHFHCHAGEGRTTTFMAMEDMLQNASSVAC